jgi:peptide/nickel transport system substrate-binding protein
MANGNPAQKLNELYAQFMNGEINRRAFLVKASTLGLSAMTLGLLAKTTPASAQEATPQQAVLPGGYQSMTYEDFRASLAEDFPFTADAGAESPGGRLIMGVASSANLSTVNPMFANNNPTQAVIFQVFEALWGNDPRNGAYVPAVANRWEIAEDGRTYTFYLHDNVTFHDGTPMTSADVVLSFDAVADETTGTSYTATFQSVVESYRAIDDFTFEVVASDVFAQVVFLGSIFATIVPSHIWGDVPFDQWQADAGSTGQDPSRVVGTGYLKFVEINEGEGTATFAKNENYWYPADIPQVDEFVFSTWPDETAAIEALRGGAFDFYERIPAAEIQSLTDAEETDVAVYDTYSFSFYGTNLDPEKTTLFQDVNVRKAMFYAIDRPTMVETIYLGYREVANGTQPILSPAYAPDRITTVYDFNPEMAASLLDEAGWVPADDGIREKDGERLSFEVVYDSGSAETNTLAVAMQDYWLAVGIDAIPTPVDFATVLVPTVTETFDYQVCMLGFNWDPDGDQSSMFHTDSYGGGFNLVKYSNPAYDELADAAKRELDEEKRVDMLIQASDIVNEDLPLAVMWFRIDATAYNSQLRNFTPNGVNLLWSVPYVWIQS